MKAHELFPDLAKEVRLLHERCDGITVFGHNFDHDLRVANYALMIAPDEQTGRLAAAAGFCHSADYFVKKPLQLSPAPEKEAEVEKLVRELLEATDLAESERNEVVDVVLHHEGANSESDSLLKITLVDADRLANLDADVIIRSGQFQPHLMAVDPVHLEHDPGATYRDPRSVLWDVNNCISWTKESGPYVLRLPKARALGKSRGAFLQLFVDTIRAQSTEAGVFPYPPELL